MDLKKLSSNFSTKQRAFRSWLRKQLPIFVTLAFFATFGITGALAYFWHQSSQEIVQEQQRATDLEVALRQKEQELTTAQDAYTLLQNEDQTVRNNTLQEEIRAIQNTYSSSVAVYEDLIRLRESGAKTQEIEIAFARSIAQLAERNYASAAGSIRAVQTSITDARQALVQQASIPTNLPTSNAPPAAGNSSRQVVETEIGPYAVDLIAADLNSTRVVVETASSETCGNDCPVQSLAQFVSSAGGFAGINGPYFCPAEYPSCAGKTNSFDTLIMNRQKTYFNSDNNVYSTVPALIFSGSSARLVGATQEWGRDTGVDAVIASQPMLLSGGNITFGGDGDPKKGSRGARSFIGTRDNMVYIGVVRNATVAEVAYVAKALGLQSALNLDSGGSTALYQNGRYLAGPGRNTPFGIVLVNK